MEDLPNKKVKLLYSYDTVLSADSVEWCPFEPYQNYFVCANYQLEEDKSNGASDEARARYGRILLFSIHPERGLELKQTINTAAVLDQKWCHNLIENQRILAVANAKHSIELYKLNDEAELEFLTKHQFDLGENKEILILSLDWCTSNENPQLICTDSKGNVHLLSFSLEKGLLAENVWHVHDFEAWIGSFYYWDTNLMFSGGDDSVFVKIDKRVGIVAKNKSHQGGVTSIHSNKTNEFIVATGSYDGNIRLWDIRNMKLAKSEVKTPGTLWRLKWDPFKQLYLLSACMDGGVHLIDCENFNSIHIVDSFYEHKKIAYGADWCYLSELNNYKHEGNAIIASCSFYDHLLCVSKVNLNKLEN